jgi:hypothetical protein
MTVSHRQMMKRVRLHLFKGIAYRGIQPDGIRKRGHQQFQ